MKQGLYCGITTLWIISKGEKAFAELRDELDFPISEIRNKLNSLRAQLGRELNKTSKKKYGQGTYEVYTSSWCYWKKLHFLKPMVQTSKSLHTMDTLPNASIDDGEIESADADSGSGELENQMVIEQPDNKRSKPSSKSYQERLSILKRCNAISRVTAIIV